MTDIRVPITAAQHRRLTTLMQSANAAAALRDNVLSALVEGVIDQAMEGYTIQVAEDAIILRAPTLAPENGVLAQADAMSP